MNRSVPNAKTNLNNLKESFNSFLNNDKQEISKFIKSFKTISNKPGEISFQYHLSIIFEDYVTHKKNPYGKVTENYAIISNEFIDDIWYEKFDHYYHLARKWIKSHLDLADGSITFVMVHIDRNYSFVPRTYLYDKEIAARIGFHSVEIRNEFIIHELLHALSYILDRFASELLCYHAEFSGLEIIKTYYKENEDRLDVHVEDVLIFNREDLPDVYNIFFGYKQGEAVEIQNITLLPYFMSYMYTFLKTRKGEKGIDDYFKNIDKLPDINAKIAYFKDQFGIELNSISNMINMELMQYKDTQRVMPKSEEEISKVYDEMLETDFYQLIYLKTYVKKYFIEENILYRTMIANIDFEMYKAYKMGGEIKKDLLRQIYRNVKAIVEEDDNRYKAWILLYHIITEYIIINYKFNIKEDLSKLERVEQTLLGEVKFILNKADILDKNNSETKFIHGNFHLFYPFFIGANTKKGLQYMNEVYEMDKNNRSVYYALIFFYDMKKNRKMVDTWIKLYNDNFDKKINYGTIKAITNQYLNNERSYE